MLEDFVLNGTFKGTIHNQPLTVQIDHTHFRIDVEKLEALKAIKDILYKRFKSAEQDDTLSKLMNEVDIEVYLEEELIARIGKNAKPNFMSNMLGIKHVEIVSNSRMSDLMKLL